MFLIRCPECKWKEETTGLSRDLAHLNEIRSGCNKCGKPRKFKCPNCGTPAVMVRKAK